MLTKGRTTFLSSEKIRFFFTLELLMDKSAQRSGQTGILVKLKTVNSNLALLHDSFCQRCLILAKIVRRRQFYFFSCSLFTALLSTH